MGVIREFYHFMQIVDDFDDATERYARLLSPQVFIPKHWSDFDLRWASLAMVGPELVFELMEPSTKTEDLGAPLPKFRARHGEHFHSFAWLVDDDQMPAWVDGLRAAGVRVIEPYPAGREHPWTVFTHPKDTLGQMEFQGTSPGNAARRATQGPHCVPGWTGAYWRDEHPLGLERLSHLTLMAGDLDRGQHVYADLLGGRVFHRESGPDRESVFVVMGEDVPGREIVIELAKATDPGSRLAADFAAHGEMPHAMTFLVRDLVAAEKHVADCGFSLLDERTDETITVDPADLHNGVVSFTTRRLPNDPRR